MTPQIVGCKKSKESPPSANGSAARILRVPVLATTSLDTLDPIQSVEIVQYDIINQIYEGLVRVGQNGKCEPALAERWEHSDDFRIWRFYLRDARFGDDRCFSDGKGRRVTPADVAYSLKRGLSPSQGSKNSWALSKSVLGAAEYSAGKTTDVPGIRLSDPGMIEIELTAGDRFFLAALTVPSTYVVPREAVEKYEAGFGTHPVGSGPYQLSEWAPGQRIVLRRNAQFGVGEGWQPPPPAVDEVRLTFFRAEAQIATEFDRGMLDVRPVLGSDIAGATGTDVRASMKARNPNAKIIDPGWVCKVHLFAMAMGPQHVFGSSATARRALSELIPRAQIEEGVLRGTGRSQSTILPTVLFPSARPPAPLPDARASLRAAIDSKTVRVAYVSSRTNDVIIDLLKSIIEEAGGELQLFPSTSLNTLFGSLATTKPDITLLYWSPYFPSLPDYLTALLSTNRPVPNFTGFVNDTLDTLAAELRRGSGRDSALVAAEVDELLGRTMPWVPLYIETPLFLATPRVVRFSVSPVSVTQFSSAELSGQP